MSQDVSHASIGMAQHDIRRRRHENASWGNTGGHNLATDDNVMRIKTDRWMGLVGEEK